jgi:hypothetical protein
MGLQVIAEGIEDLDQADWLLRHGCAMAQGFAFGRPAPLPTPAELLIDEVTEAPAAEAVEETPAQLAGAYPAPLGAQPPGEDHATADLGQRLDELADDASDGDGAGADVLPFPTQRTADPAEGLVEAATGELFDALPDDPRED